MSNPLSVLPRVLSTLIDPHWTAIVQITTDLKQQVRELKVDRGSSVVVVVVVVVVALFSIYSIYDILYIYDHIYILIFKIYVLTTTPKNYYYSAANKPEFNRYTLKVSVMALRSDSSFLNRKSVVIAIKL